MKKWNNAKYFVLGMAVCMLLSVFAFPSAAAGRQKQALLDYPGIQISLDGQAITPADANGNTVEPFAIEGTTYLPVRAVAEALGLAVAWDGDTNTVILSSGNGTPEDTAPPQEPAAQQEEPVAPQPRYAQAGESAPPVAGTIVWRANKTTRFYHSSQLCSNMRSPETLSIEDALDLGLDPCTKCWAQ